jgi:hypothetical protein
MRNIIFTALQLLMVVTFLSAETNTYTLKAIKFYDTYYAEWGLVNDKEYEDRYDGMECEIYENGKLIGVITVFQHWFNKNRKQYPKIGETIKVEAFDYKVNRIPAGKYNVEFSELKIVK